MRKLRADQRENNKDDCKPDNEINVDLIAVVAGHVEPGLFLAPQCSDQPRQLDGPGEETDKDGYEIERQKQQIHPCGICAVAFHCGKRTTNHMPADSNREKLAVRLNQRWDSPKRDHAKRE